MDEVSVAEQPSTRIDSSTLIILPMRNFVLFPGVIMPVSLGRARTVAGAVEAVKNKLRIGFLLQQDPKEELPDYEGLHRIGTVASVIRHSANEDGTYQLVVQGEKRYRVLDFQQGTPFLMARVELLPETKISTEIEARSLNLKKLAVDVIHLLPQAPAELAHAVQSIESPEALADLVASFIDTSVEEKQKLLETLDLSKRLDQISELLLHRIEVLKMQQQLEIKTREAIDEKQKKYLLREQMRQIQKQLGEEDSSSSEVKDMLEKIESAGMDSEVLEQVKKEVHRLEKMSEGGSEYSMQMSWLECIASMPWNILDTENIDIARAKEILEMEHYGLQKIKRRIVEYLAVRKLNPNGKSPILCFIGPPGVGKTSLGNSISKALGLKFVRISLGGLHDEAEIRGHRRTYIGAMPGNIVQALRRCKSRNPVLILDEIDKLGAGMHGDPASALLEVLDPEQNKAFRDNYLGIDLDLSKVLFIATANQLDTIPEALKDRLEVIELTGYTEEEKMQIAKRYLVERQLEENGLDSKQIAISDESLRKLISGYTREAGCRTLERTIGSVFRYVAVGIADGSIKQKLIELEDIPKILGQPRFESEIAMRTSIPGIATGLAWTPTGGDILFIEATRVPGKGNLLLTGQLGDVMKESAQAALSLLKSRATQLKIDPVCFEASDVHIHVPAGAIPKDGPSAGVSIYTSLVSLFLNRKVNSDVAMTGEISLRGLVLPIGGVKEKSIAAHRAGIKKILLPQRNHKDYEEIPESVRASVEFVFCTQVEDVIREAIDW